MASRAHETTIVLAWTEGEGFTIEDKPELTEDAVAEMILAAIASNAGKTWSKIEKTITASAPTESGGARSPVDRWRDRRTSPRTRTASWRSSNKVEGAKKANSVFWRPTPSLIELHLKPGAVAAQSGSGQDEGST